MEQTLLGRVGLPWRAHIAGMDNGSQGPSWPLGTRGPQCRALTGEPCPPGPRVPPWLRRESPGSPLTFHHQPGAGGMELGAQGVEAHVGEADPSHQQPVPQPVRGHERLVLVTEVERLVLKPPGGAGAGARQGALEDGVPPLLAADIGQRDHHVGRDGCRQMQGVTRTGRRSPGRPGQAGWATAAGVTLDRSPLTPGVGFST